MRHAPTHLAAFLLALLAGTVAAEETAPNPVKALFEARKWAEALVEADRLGTDDPVTELHAARSLRQLERHEEARARYLRLAERHPTDENAASALIEAATMLTAGLEQEAWTDADRERAARAAAELEEAARKWEARPDIRSRALYIAGNTWRIAARDGAALDAYERARLPGSDPGYVAKSLEREGFLAERMLDPERARALFTECVANHGRTSSGRRAQKGLERLAIIGTPLPEPETETWIPEAPVKATDLRGDVTLIFHFATWCPHCKRTLPRAAELLDRYGSRGFRVIGLTANTKGQTTDAVRELIRDDQYRIGYPVAIDLEERTSTALAATGLPACVLVDRTGVIRWVGHPAYITDALLETLLAAPRPAGT